MSKGEARRINAEPDARVYCLRLKSGWANKEILSQITHLMGVALKPHPGWAQRSLPTRSSKKDARWS